MTPVRASLPAPQAVPPAVADGRGQRVGACALMVLSGFAALAYQVVWTQQAGFWLGHDAAGILAVVGAFFGGLALGSLALGTRVERSARPARWYAACEVVIAAWAIGLAFLMGPASHLMLAWIGPQPDPAWHWTVAFGGTFLLLLPATAAMGATLPAMEMLLSPVRGRGSSLGALYSANASGAVAGALLTAFWLVPAIGLTRTALLCAALNLVCAALAWAYLDAAVPNEPAPPRAERAGATAWLLAATGFLGIGYEVVVIRVLSQVSENTVYTFAMLLAVYLVGTAAGAAAWQRRSARIGHDESAAARLALALAGACLAGTLVLWWADAVKDLPLALFGRSFAVALSGEALAAALAFLLPTAFMGALFTQLCTEAKRAGLGFAQNLGANTLGAAAAPAVFGMWLVPAIGPARALLAIVAGYLVVALLRQAPRRQVMVAAALVATVAALAPPLRFVDVPEGGRVTFYREGALGAVSVVEDPGGVARLRIDNRQQEGSSGTVPADGRQALLPLMLHPAPAHALFLGLGTGITASVAAADPALQVDAVELLPEVIEASALFRAPFRNAGIDDRLQIVAADARRYVRAAPRSYDLIVADNFHPARSGSGALYTVEHFVAVRARLAEGGLFFQWLPLHQLDLPTLRSIVRSFLAAFPEARALLATNSLETPVLGLVGLRDSPGFDAARVVDRSRRLGTSVNLAAFGLGDDHAVLGSFVAGPAALARFAGTAPLNTDDRPVVAAMAPRVTYAPDSEPADRLLALLEQIDVTLRDVLVGQADAATADRLQAYWQARDLYLAAGRDVVPLADARAMLDQVAGPLFDVLELSPDFRPAYDPLLRMALALVESDPAAGCGVLRRLAEASPQRADASEALRESCAEPQQP
jgi:spermidine synthase